MSGKTTQIAKIDNYALVQQGIDEIADIAVANLGGDEMRVIDLPRIRIPAQGGKSWLIPTAGGEESAAALEGVIIDHRKVKLYWAHDETMGQPPDCVAEDGRHGIGDPGGVCAKCPMNAFGTDPKGGRGKACKDVKQVLFLTADNILPMLLSLPPTSLRDFGQYMVSLMSIGLPHHAVVSRVELEQDKSAAGQTYSRATWSMVGRVTDEQRAQLTILRELMQALQSGVEEQDYASQG